MQLSFSDELPSLEEVLIRREDQWFDRKSFRIDARGLADVMIGFANADGGRIVVGVRDGQVEGVGSSPEHLNELRQAALDFTQPPVRHSCLYLDCMDNSGNPNQLLVLDIEASEQVHRNRKQECYLRVGDETRRLGPEEERELAFDKGEAVFDGTFVKGMTRDDLDLSTVEAYAQRIGSADISALMRSRGLYYDLPHRTGVTQAGWLLFGHVPPIWSYIRYLRYAGTSAETGVRSNLTDEVMLMGTIPSLIDQARDLLRDKIEPVIRLAPSGRFERMPALPEFAWLEAIVNALTHRSYSIQGDGIRVTQFSDRLEVESPGRLPGLVRVQNIRNSRFSRNPHIARVLAEMTGYVRELNEGVRRMFEEMERYGLRPPLYTVTEASVKVILYKEPEEPDIDEQASIQQASILLFRLRSRLGTERLRLLLTTLQSHGEMPSRDVAELLNVTSPTARGYLHLLEELGLVAQQRKSRRDPNTVWIVTESPLWAEVSSLWQVT